MSWMAAKNASCVIGLALCLGAHAAVHHVDLNASTPAIQKIKARMSPREAKIVAYKNSGHAGEAASGLIEARSISGMTLVERKSFRDALAAENDDRAALFRELALGQRISDATAVSAAYARLKRESAAPQHWVQHPKTNAWVLKKDLRE